MIDEALILKTESITNFPVGDFLTDSRNFFRDDYPSIVSFFKGETDFIDKRHIKLLNLLSERSLQLSYIFTDKKSVMNTVDFWQLLEALENLITKFQTTAKISKYLRSSLLQGRNKSGFVFEHVTDQEQTLENISDNLLGVNDFQNKWTEIALENDLKEVDWDISGGEKLNLRKQIFQANLVTSMIDNTIGEKIYGKDINRFLTYENEDLASLEYRDTVFQTVDILGNLSKGDIPEFKFLGINSDLYKGTNYSQLNYPSISRELERNFRTDDLFRDFEIKKMYHRDGDIFIEYSVDTKYELTVIKNISI